MEIRNSIVPKTLYLQSCYLCVVRDSIFYVDTQNFFLPFLYSASSFTTRYFLPPQSNFLSVHVVSILSVYPRTTLRLGNVPFLDVLNRFQRSVSQRSMLIQRNYQALMNKSYSYYFQLHLFSIILCLEKEEKSLCKLFSGNARWLMGK